MKNKLWEEKEGIVHIKLIKMINEQELYQFIKEVKEAVEKLPQKAKVLVDIREATPFRSSQFRKGAVEMLKGIAQSPGFQKVAIFGGGVIKSTIASFVIAASGLKNIKVFGKKEDALKWLKES